MTQTNDITAKLIEAAKHVKVDERPLRVKEYRLMYYVGVWFTKPTSKPTYQRIRKKQRKNP